MDHTLNSTEETRTVFFARAAASFASELRLDVEGTFDDTFSRPDGDDDETALELWRDAVPRKLIAAKLPAKWGTI